ncbi:MAG: hypothetical protein K6G51_02195, partial [Sphaerochaetaceae bacterium]|nr:hypothetical protein [Sphaerochaetaceae bacterium]
MKKIIGIVFLTLIVLAIILSCSDDSTVDAQLYEDQENGTFIVNGKGFATLQAAIDYLNGNSNKAVGANDNTIYLTKNTSGPGASISSGTIAIDFQGHTFSFTNVNGLYGEDVSGKDFGITITSGADVSLKGMDEISLYDPVTKLTMVYLEGSGTTLTVEEAPKMVVEDDQYVFWAANGATLTIGSSSSTDTEATIRGKIAATGTTGNMPTVSIKSATNIEGTIEATTAKVELSSNATVETISVKESSEVKAYGSSRITKAVEAVASSVLFDESSSANASITAKEDASIIIQNTDSNTSLNITTINKDSDSNIIVSNGTVTIDGFAEGSDTVIQYDSYATVNGSAVVTQSAITYAARIGNVLYSTVADAAASTSTDNNEICLLCDVDSIAIGNGQEVVLNLKSKKVNTITNAGTMTVSDGTVSSGLTSSAGSTTTINGGTYTNINVSSGTSTIKDGTFSGTISLSSENTKVEGGSFNLSSDIRNNIGEGFIIVPEGERYVVKPSSEDAGTYIASIGSVRFNSIEAALNAAVENDTVTILNDCTATDAVTISKSMTINLNGKTVTGSDKWTISSTEVSVTCSDALQNLFLTPSGYMLKKTGSGSSSVYSIATQKKATPTFTGSD